MTYRWFGCVLILCVVTLGYAETARDRRHDRIHKRLKETAHLKYNYFAPSVHIRYHHPESKVTYRAYYNEIRVERTVRHTYFCTIGFDVGYFGIQDHGSGHIAIFSVWDKGGGKNNSSAVDKADRTEVTFTHSKATSSRFGGEGSGAKTMMPFAWEVSKTYAFLVLLTPLENGTLYTAWISEKGKAWEKVATYKTVMTKKALRGFHSFIEDYVRNGKTGQESRLAFYPEQGAMTSAGDWQRIVHGSGSIADDVIQNGHSGVRENVFFSQSGADTADFGTQPKRFSIVPSEEVLAIDLLPQECSLKVIRNGQGLNDPERQDAWKKVEFNLDQLDRDGLRGPTDGKVALSYEFCIPNTDDAKAQVRAIDRTVQFMPGSRGRIGATKQQCLCVGATHQENYRAVLLSLAELSYVEQIIECHFE